MINLALEGMGNQQPPAPALPQEIPMKLTAGIIDSLTCPAGQIDKTYFDDSLPGFGLRCRGSGVRRYVVQFELNGHSRRITIGAPEVLGIEEARRIARQHLAKKALGHDPAMEKAEARRAAKHTLGAVVTDYLAVCQARLRPSSMEHMRRYLRDWWKPLHGVPIAELTRRDIAGASEWAAGCRGSSAQRLMACCRWAIEQGYTDANPVIGTGVPDKYITPRERVLSLDEIAAIWKACDGPYAYDTIIRLLIVTACRRQEIGSLQHSELDWENGLLIIPPERAKNKRTHTLPLPPLAWSIIDAWVERGAFPDHLFSGKGFKAWAINKSALDRRCTIGPWVLHDLRRSVATHLGDMGVAPHTIEAILGHQTGSRVARTYNRSAYLNEMRIALATWASRLDALIDGGERKIIPLRQ